jgi:hypothetical protein
MNCRALGSRPQVLQVAVDESPEIMSRALKQLLVLAADGAQSVDHYLVLLLQMAHDLLKFFFRFEIYEIVLVGGDSVLSGLPVLRHHDDRRCVRGLKAQYQIQKDERVGIPMS